MKPMNMRLAMTTGCSVVLILSTFGCVSLDTYDEIQREADAARAGVREAQVQYAQERLKVLSLEKRNEELKQQTDKWEVNLRGALERLEFLAGEWGDVRDDLIRLNIERELHQMRTRNPNATGAFRLEPRKKPASSRKATQRSLIIPKNQDRQELEDVLEEFRGLLEKSWAASLPGSPGAFRCSAGPLTNVRYPARGKR